MTDGSRVTTTRGTCLPEQHRRGSNGGQPRERSQCPEGDDRTLSCTPDTGWFDRVLGEIDGRPAVEPPMPLERRLLTAEETPLELPLPPGKPRGDHGESDERHEGERESPEPWTIRRPKGRGALGWVRMRHATLDAAWTGGVSQRGNRGVRETPGRPNSETVSPMPTGNRWHGTRPCHTIQKALFFMVQAHLRRARCQNSENA